MLHVCTSVCRSCSPPEAVAIHKAWKIFSFADIADKTATARTQHVHGTVGSLSLVMSMKTRYRTIFKGSPLARWVCTQISRYSHRPSSACLEPSSKGEGTSHISHGCVFLAHAGGFEVNPGWVNLRVHDAPPHRPRVCFSGARRRI